MLCSPVSAKLAAHMNNQGVTVAKVEPALEAVFRAFENHPVVALGDRHGLAAQMDFYTAVVRILASHATFETLWSRLRQNQQQVIDS